MVNINLFGGPCVGKSSVSSSLFAELKALHLRVEQVHEYAKDLTYNKDYVRLSDQVAVLGEQHHRLFRLKGHADLYVC